MRSAIRRMSLSISGRSPSGSPAAMAVPTSFGIQEIQFQTPTQQEESKSADSRNFSVDLEASAFHLLKLLRDIARYPELVQPNAHLTAAIYRYEKYWLPLAKSHPEIPLYPPLDVAWIWACHRMVPTLYLQDCDAVCGGIVDWKLPEDLVSAMKMAEVLWRELYPDVPFELTTAWSPPTADNYSVISCDLIKLVAENYSFCHQVSAPHFRHPKFVANAVRRYKRFVYLIQKTARKQCLFPSFDIDLVWKAHQLHPFAFAHDYKMVIGKSTTRTDLFEFIDERVNTTEVTANLWHQTFGENYYQAGSSYRGEPDVLLVNAKRVRKMTYFYMTNDTEEADVNVALYGAVARKTFQLITNIRYVEGLHHAEKHPKDQCHVSITPLEGVQDRPAETADAPYSAPVFNTSLAFIADETSKGLKFAIKRNRNIRKDAKTASGLLHWGSLHQSPLSTDWKLDLHKRGEPRGTLYLSTCATPMVKSGTSLIFENLGSTYTQDDERAVSWGAKQTEKSQPLFNLVFSVPRSTGQKRKIVLNYNGGKIEATQEKENSMTIQCRSSTFNLVLTQIIGKKLRCEFRLDSIHHDANEVLVIQFGRRLQYASRASEVPEMRTFTIVRYSALYPYGEAVALLNMGTVPCVEVVSSFDVGLASIIFACGIMFHSIYCVPVTKLASATASTASSKQQIVSLDGRKPLLYDDDGVAVTGVMWLTMYAASGIADSGLGGGLASLASSLDLMDIFGAAADGIGLGEIFSAF